MMELTKPLMVVVLMAIFLISCSQRDDWSTASRESAGIAPDPAITSEAVLHVYGADAWSWRGWFAIHTWIATKRKDEDSYTLYDVIGWRGFNGQEVMEIYRGIPDRYWYGARPRLLKAHLGTDAEMLIDAVDAAARAYPWKKIYQAFPGPNSNTFTAWVAQQVPERGLERPLSALGRGHVDPIECGFASEGRSLKKY